MADDDFDLSPDKQTEPPVLSQAERAAVFAEEEPRPPGIPTPEDQQTQSEEAPEEAAASELSSTESPSVDSEDDARQKTVPHQALHEERELRKSLQQQLANQEKRFEQFTERFAQQVAPKDEQPQVPDFDEDPALNLDTRLKQQEEAARVVQEQQQQMAAAQQEQQQMAAFQADFQARESQFASKTPDYYEATNFLRENRAKELSYLGYTPQQAIAAVDQEAMHYAVLAQNQGQDPVQMFYDIAKQRGYKGAAPASAPAGNNVDLRQIQQNMDRSESMGSRGGSPKGTTLADLANMTDSEFDQATTGDAWENLWN